MTEPILSFFYCTKDLVEKDIKTDSANQYYLINFMGFLSDKRFLIDRKNCRCM